MRPASVILIACVLSGCATPQYRTRFVAFAGAAPSMPAAQVEAICRAQAEGAYAQARSAAQGQLNARNNQVTGYNCSTYGQANAYGNSATYNGSTNCTAQTANNYGGKYGAFVALGDAAGVEGAAINAHNSVLSGCAAQQGYRLEKYCVANCGDSGSYRPVSQSVTTTPSSSSSVITETPINATSTGILTEADLRAAPDASLCYRSYYHGQEKDRELAARLLRERGVICERGTVVR
jgi:hypothetical protein